jgi:putative heme-binding domain-containing protein
VPDFGKATDADLVKLLESASHRTRLEAQRTLVRRAKVAGPENANLIGPLGELAGNRNVRLEARVAAIYTETQWLDGLSRGGVRNWRAGIFKLIKDETIRPWALRALSEEDRPWPGGNETLDVSLKSPDARSRREAAAAIGRSVGLYGVAPDGAPANRFRDEELGQELLKEIPAQSAKLASLLGDSDPIVAHTAMQILRQLSASEPCFAILDNAASATPLREGALMVLRGIHDAKAVDGLVTRLAKSKDPTQRQGLLTALCRLHFVEGKWTGNSWGTRPDTRGPYYQPEEWAESKKILEVLKATLNSASNEEAAFLAKEFARHRIKLNDATVKLITLAEKDASLLPVLAKQLAEADSIPDNALPLLLKAASDPTAKEDVLLAAVQSLAKADNAESVRAILDVLGRLGGDARNKARDAFFNSRLVENHHQLLEATAEKADGSKPARWADAALLKLAARKVGAPEPREMAAKSLDTGWAQPKRRLQIIKAAIDSEDKSRATQIAAALTDPDKEVAKAAEEAVKKLKLDPAKLAASAKPGGPLISTLKPEDVLAQVMTAKGGASRGEQVFTQQGCVACHTVKASELPKGPFLGNIATIYKRRELAEAVLLPNKTIAQGFVTNIFTMKDGSVQMGFVTQEAADKVVMRNIAAQEITLDPKNIVKREKGDKSLMPDGLVAGLTVTDFAALIDYMEALAKK